MKNPVSLLFSLLVFAGTGCQSNPSPTHPPTSADTVKKSAAPPVAVPSNGPANNAAATIALKQIPVLCYHQIRDWKASDSKKAKDYIVPVGVFREQMKMLADSGYHTISPDELLAYLTNNRALPSKPVMLTFDDTDLGQYTEGFSQMRKYGFKGMFFIMTVSLGRPNYMTKEQVKELSDSGNVVGSHTWDHHNVKKYEGKDWETQIDKPTRQLETITGKPIRYFAYPFGLWNEEAIPELKKRNFEAAFQLVTRRDDKDPLFTIRRMIVPGYWSTKTLLHAMKSNF